MAVKEISISTRIAPIDCDKAVDWRAAGMPARCLRSERLILTARINFNP